MIKTFVAEFKALWKSRLRFASWIILLFMPLIYGFLFLSSFWSPFKNTDKLPMVVVNMDGDSQKSQALVNALTNNGKDLIFSGGSSEYKIHIDDATDVYKQNDNDKVEHDVNTGKYTAAFVIPKGYGVIAQKIEDQIVGDMFDGNVDIADYGSKLRTDIENQIATSPTKSGLVDFYNSFKVSYVAGEMTNMGSSLYRLIGNLMFPDVKALEPTITSIEQQLTHVIGDLAKAQSTAATQMASGIISKIDPSLVKILAGVALQGVSEAQSKLAIILDTMPTLKTAFTKVMTDIKALTTTADADVSAKIQAIVNTLTAININIKSITVEQLQPIVDGVKTKVMDDLHASNALVNHVTYGKREGVTGQHDILNTYGYGLSPYFISIVLWAGALLMAFLFPNKRYIKTEGTFANLSGKLGVWILTGWIQVLLLFAVISIPGVFGSLTYHLADGTTVTIKQCINLGGGQWKLILFALFMSTMFMLIVRGILYTIRVADIGLFIVVILLILQLVSSGGTFPVSMQPKFFSFLHKILPFTYTVNAIREIYWDTDAMVVLKDCGILLIIPTIFTITSYIANLIWDNKTKYKRNGLIFYRSMDKNVGSL